jgi:dTMP kinase
MSATHPGIFIALEGIDGSGTTTHARLLTNAFREADPSREVVLTREPSETVVTDLIRGWLEPDGPKMDKRALCLAFVLDRYLHVHQVIAPALRRGAVVITDRYKLSTLAYQTLELPEAWVLSLLEGPDPDLYVLLDVDPDHALTRVLSRGTTLDRYESRLDFQRRVAERYLWAVDQTTAPTVLVTPDGTVDDTHQAIRAAVAAIPGAALG